MAMWGPGEGSVRGGRGGRETQAERFGSSVCSAHQRQGRSLGREAELEVSGWVGWVTLKASFHEGESQEPEAEAWWNADGEELTSHRAQVISKAVPWPSAPKGPAPGQVAVPHFAVISKP